MPEALDSMPPIDRMRWKAGLGGAGREWMLPAGFGCVLVLSGLLFIWISRHDPVHEGRVDALSVALWMGSSLAGLALFALAVRDWTDSKLRNPKRRLLRSGEYCPRCHLAWDGEGQAEPMD